MEDTSTIREHVKEYIDARVGIVKLKLISKLSPLVSNVILGIVLLVLGIFTLMFLSFSAAYAISFATDKPYLGFLLVGCFHLLLAVVVVVLKNKLLTTPIMRSLLESFYYQHESEKKTDRH